MARINPESIPHLSHSGLEDKLEAIFRREGNKRGPVHHVLGHRVDCICEVEGVLVAKGFARPRVGEGDVVLRVTESELAWGQGIEATVQPEVGMTERCKRSAHSGACAPTLPLAVAPTHSS